MADKSKDKLMAFFTLMFLTIIFISCGRLNSNSPTDSFTEISTHTSLPMTTSTLTSTPTMEPTLAFWATAQENQFNGIYTQIAETKVSIATLATQFPQYCVPDFEGVFKSPNEKWVAVDCPYLEGGEFHVFSTFGNEWVISYSEVFENYPNDSGSIDALHWSNDGKYLYFTNNPCCPDTDTLSNGNTLFVLNLQTGEWKSIVVGYFNYFLFSPTDNRLVYVPCSVAGSNTEINLHVLDLSTKQEGMIHIGIFEQAGYATWNPNGQQLALFAKNGNTYDENEKFSLVIMNLIEKTSDVIIFDSMYPSYITDWSDDDILTIKTYKLIQYGENFFVNTNEISYYDVKLDSFVLGK